MARILIVDDDKVMAEMLVQQLTTERLEATAANCVNDALALFDERPFEVVVADIQMRERDGFELLREIQQRAPEVPVVLITAFASDDVRTRADREGAFAFLAKPFTIDQLLDTVARALAPRD